MAKCISPSAGHSSSTNVLIVGAGWCWATEGKGEAWKVGEASALVYGPITQVLLA